MEKTYPVSELKLFDNVILKNGRKTSIVEILGKKEAFIVDVDIGGDYETETVTPEQILGII